MAAMISTASISLFITFADQNLVTIQKHSLERCRKTDILLIYTIE